MPVSLGSRVCEFECVSVVVFCERILRSLLCVSGLAPQTTPDQSTHHLSPGTQKQSRQLNQYSSPRFSAVFDFGGARRLRLRSSCSITGTAAGMNSTPRFRLFGRACSLRWLLRLSWRLNWSLPQNSQEKRLGPSPWNLERH